jgi:hypothetical protein
LLIGDERPEPLIAETVISKVIDFKSVGNVIFERFGVI